ncbi:MAG: MFS transporter [Actinobacteria bacterium]|nr:MFS transporter [Actinomycetota bacterium]
MPKLPESLQVLRRREFRLLFTAQFVSVLGDRMVAVALAFAVLQIGGTPAEVGIVLAARILPSSVCALVGGAVADRVSRRAVMVASDLVRVVSQGAMAGLLIGGVAQVWTLAVLAGVGGAASGFFGPASVGLIAEVLPPDQLQPANALRSSGSSAGEILGPLLAGVLVASAGAGWAIAADAVTFALSAACLLMLRLPRRVGSGSSSFLADLREGWAIFSAHTWVWTCVTYFAAANLFWGAWSSLGPVVADRDLGGAAVWGTILAAAGAGALLGSLLATQVRPARPLVFVALSEALFALPLGFLAATSAVPLLLLAALLSGVGLMLGMSVWESTLQRRVPAESLSRVSSFDWFGSFLFYPVGLAIWGPVSAAIGIHTALWLAFGLFLLTILGLLAVPAVRRLTWSPGTIAEPPRHTTAADAPWPD